MLAMHAPRGIPVKVKLTKLIDSKNDKSIENVVLLLEIYTR